MKKRGRPPKNVNPDPNKDNPEITVKKKGVSLADYFQSPDWNNLRRMHPLVMIFTKQGVVENVIIKQVVDPGVTTVDPRTAIPTTEPPSPTPVLPPPLEQNPFDDLPPVSATSAAPPPAPVIPKPKPTPPVAPPPVPPIAPETTQELKVGSKIDAVNVPEYPGQRIRGTIGWIAPDDSQVLLEVPGGKRIMLSKPKEQIDAILY